MYYLKCKQCATYNEIINEYQTFCKTCSAKLDPNFTMWKSRNPGKSFEQFQTLMCTAHDEMIRASVTSAHKKKRLSNTVILLLILVLFFSAIGIAGYFVTPYAKQYLAQTLSENQDAIIEQISSQKWKSYTCGNLGLELESPLPLKATQDLANAIPPDAKKMLKNMDMYMMHTPLANMVITASSFQYTDEIQVSLEGAKNGTLNSYKNMPGLSNFTSLDADYSLNGITGLLTTGKFTINNVPTGVKLLTLVDGQYMYQVSVIYDQTGQHGLEFAERVMRTIKINR